MTLQHDLEVEMLDRGVERFRLSMEQNPVANTTVGRGYIASKLTEMFYRVEHYGRLYQKGHPLPGSSQWGPVLTAMDLNKLCVLALGHLLDLVYARGSFPMAGAAAKIGRAVKDQFDIDSMKEMNKVAFRRFEERVARIWTQRRIERARRVLGNSGDPWPAALRARVGLLLLECAAEVGIIEIRRHKTMLHVRLTEQTYEEIGSSISDLEYLRPVWYPMIVKPNRWTPTEPGGYLLHRYRMVKAPTGIDHAIGRGQEDVHGPMVYDAINALQETPWRINKDILFVASRLLKKNIQIPGLFPPEPPPPLKAEQAFPRDQPEEVQRAWLRRSAERYKKINEDLQERMEVVATLRMAERFKDEPNLYFPHKYDCRGRIYAVPGPINPQAADLPRAMLEFSQEDRPSDASWILIHAANCWGVKGTFEERRDWAIDRLPHLPRNAAQALENLDWTEADDPWQFLAAILDYRKWADTGVSRVPIHMDGSNSGLQHYSAILRDPVGGALVNLVPSPRPQDIYESVAVKVGALVERDCRAADPMTLDDQPCSWWRGKITRKVCKRGTMTYVYGITRVGLRNYIKTDGHADDFPSRYRAALYLSPLIWRSIEGTVVAAAEGMEWLRRVAQLSAKHNVPLTWVTPAGFKARQEYLLPTVVRIDTIRHRVNFGIYTEESTISPHRQKNALPPNFIHSMDAAHLCRVAVEMRRRGHISFGFIHDSFGVPASAVPELRRVLREEFVLMYTMDVLADWATQIQAQIPEPLPPPPEYGTLDLRQVLDSEYMFA